MSALVLHGNFRAELTGGNQDPECIEEDEVKPEVVRLRTVKPLSSIKVIEKTGCVVEEITIIPVSELRRGGCSGSGIIPVELASRDECLQWMAIWRISGDEKGRQERQWTPGCLELSVVQKQSGIVNVPP